MFADTASSSVMKHAEEPDLPSIRPVRRVTLTMSADGKMTRDEAQTGTRLDRFDGNGDGFHQQEINADVRRPDIIFSDRYHHLRGKRVDNGRRTGTRATSSTSTSPTNGLFAGDYVWIDRLCCNFAFDRRPITTWIASIKALEQLDFDILVNSHYAAGTKADLIRFREMLEDLASQVQAGIKAGRTVEELEKTVKLDKYSTFTGYPEQVPHRPLCLHQPHEVLSPARGVLASLGTPRAPRARPPALPSSQPLTRARPGPIICLLAAASGVRRYGELGGPIRSPQEHTTCVKHDGTGGPRR
jgi:hypothetical protein